LQFNPVPDIGSRLRRKVETVVDTLSVIDTTKPGEVVLGENSSLVREAIGGEFGVGWRPFTC
jgi:hypothetical protein